MYKDKVIYTFPNGETKEMILTPEMTRHHGIKVKGARPIKAEVFGNPSKEYITKGVFYMLHPCKYEIYLNNNLIHSSECKQK